MVTFAAFLQSVGFTPTAAQALAFGVLFDGVEVPETPLGVTLFGGPLGDVPSVAHRTALLVKGARVGGSLLGAYRMLHLALTLPLDSLAPGEQAFAVIVAPDLRLARQSLRYVIGIANRVSSIRRTLVGDTSDSVTLRRKDGREITIECLPATRGGSALRGRTLVGALFSEAAFFRDENFVVNDDELARAVAPRIVPGGQLVIESTPWTEAGLVYKLFADNFGAPKTAIVAHAPTLVMRPELADIVAVERQRDPDNARREYDAEFLSGTAGAFFGPVAIDRAAVLPIEAARAIAGQHYTAGADWGFESDSSALVIIGSSVATDGEIFANVAALEELRPKKGAPLVPSAVVDAFAQTCTGLGIDRVMSDAHYRQAIAEHFGPHKIRLVDAPAGNTGKQDVYLRARELLHTGRVRFPNHPRLVAQLKSIISRPLPGGGLRIDAPRRGGSGHGDLVSAFTLALWQAKGNSRRQARGGFYGNAGRTDTDNLIGGNADPLTGGGSTHWSSLPSNHLAS